MLLLLLDLERAQTAKQRVQDPRGDVVDRLSHKLVRARANGERRGRGMIRGSDETFDGLAYEERVGRSELGHKWRNWTKWESLFWW